MTPHEHEGGPDPPEEESARPADESQLRASWGGLNLSVKGSLVVLALLVIAGSGVVVWVLGQQNLHFDRVLQEADDHMLRQDEHLEKHIIMLGELKTTVLLQNQVMVREVELNRQYLREIERVCMLTPEQRLKMQQSLSPTMRELLLKDFKP